METFAALPGELEIRIRDRGGVLRGRFPYGRTATVADRGRRRKERIGPDAFGWQMREFQKLMAEIPKVVAAAAQQARRELLEEQLERRNVHILAGHDFNKPLGDMKRGTARVVSTKEALEFEVDLPDEADMPTYMLDAIKEVRTGRAGGISPGFKIPPPGVVPGAMTIEPEPGNPGVEIRVVNQAVLYEVSVVSRPTYGSTDVDLRVEDFGVLAVPVRPRVRRWL